jgi:hypothetical protein
MSKFALVLSVAATLMLQATLNTKSTEAAEVSAQPVTGTGDEVFHVAIFRFAKEHINDATAALSAHERSEAFIRFGQGVLAKYATLHDTVTASPFDVIGPPPPSR